jgi:hypothetical protein
MGDFMQGNGDSAVAVPFSDDETAGKETEELLEDDSPNASPEERITRATKRKERITRLLNDGKQAAAEAKQLREEQAALRAELQQLKGFVAAQPTQRAPQAPDKDPYEAELDKVYEMQNDAYLAAQAEIKAGTFTPERQKHYEGIARKVESEKTRIHTERVMERRAGSMRAEQAQQVWVQKYPDVYNNPNAYQFAEATFRRRKALGENITNETVDEIMNEAMTTFRLGPKRTATVSEKSRMSGLPSSGSGGGSSRDSGVTLTPQLRRMAVAAYSDLPEPEAIKKWVNSTGKRLREKKVI